MNPQAYEQLTLFPVDSLSPANHFPWLESKKEKGTTVTYGRKCSELSESLRRVGLSVRTYLESCELPGKQFARTWSVKDTLSPYLILKLRLSERRTGGSESRLWPTATSRDYKDGSAEACRNVPVNGLLGRAVHIPRTTGLWKTPVAADMADRQMYVNSRGEPNLSGQVKLWATPNAADCIGTTGGGQGRSLRTDVHGSLNPDWVEWLMGFPIGWTDIGA